MPRRTILDELDVSGWLCEEPASLLALEHRLGHVRQALDEAVAVGEWLARRMRALTQALELIIEQAGLGSPCPLPLWDELTPREREVARLVARGLTNRQIAAALVVSDKTVETHVGHILAKLGHSSRAQIIAHAQAAQIRGLAQGYP